MSDCHDCSAGTTLVAAPPLVKQRIVAIIGPPNSGKSTLFNRLTGLRQKVANFPGVTVEHRMGKVKLDPGREVFVVDLPGVYSLTPRTEDERVTHDVLLGKMKDLPRPEAILLILDSTNLSRHLVLAAPVLSLGLPTLVILNMADDLARRRSRCGGTGRTAGHAGGAGERIQGNRPRQGVSISGRRDRDAAQAAARGAAGDPEHSPVPGLGGERGQIVQVSSACAALVDTASGSDFLASGGWSAGVRGCDCGGVPAHLFRRQASYGFGATGH